MWFSSCGDVSAGNRSIKAVARKVEAFIGQPLGQLMQYLLNQVKLA